jgi:hypothetical protein
MKKLLLLIATFFAFTIANAQEKEQKLTIKKGTWSYGGNFSLNFENNENENQTYTSDNDHFRFNLYPKIGYAIEDNLTLGLGLGYGYSKNEYEYSDSGNDELKSNSFSIFPYIKKHIPLGNKLAVFVQGEARLSTFKTDYSSEDYERTGNSVFIGVRPGITYFLNNKVALEANFGSLGYSHSSSENSDNNPSESSSNYFNLNLNSSDLYFGITVYL